MRSGADVLADRVGLTQIERQWLVTSFTAWLVQLCQGWHSLLPAGSNASLSAVGKG